MDVLSKHPGEPQHISKLAGNKKIQGSFLFKGKPHVLTVGAIYRKKISPKGQSPCGHSVLKAKKDGHDQTTPAGERMSSEIELMCPELTASSVTITNLPTCPTLREKKGPALAFAGDCYTKRFLLRNQWKGNYFRK